MCESDCEVEMFKDLSGGIMECLTEG